MEHEQIFDLLRKHGPEIIDGKQIEVSGSGSWKTLTVSDEKTGEVSVEKKFYKAEFNEVIANPEYSSYIEDLLELALVRKMSSDEGVDIDTDSYEEVRSVAMELEEDLLVHPEA